MFDVMTGKNRAVIRDEGGIEVVVSAMTRFHDDAVLHGRACGALWNLAVNGA